MKVYCNLDELKLLLDRRPMTWLCDKVNELGVKAGYRSFVQNIQNNTSVECRLSFALAVAKIFNVPVEQLFYLKNEHNVQ